MENKTIFIVEDDFIKQTELAKRLEDEGFKIVSGSGENILSKLIEAKPDIVIVNVDMKNKEDETELIGKIVATKELEDSQIFLYTESLEVSTEIKLRRHKITYYFTHSKGAENFIVEQIKRFFEAPEDDTELDERLLAYQDETENLEEAIDHLNDDEDDEEEERPKRKKKKKRARKPEVKKPEPEEEDDDDEDDDFEADFEEDFEEADENAMHEETADAETDFSVGEMMLNNGDYGGALKKFTILAKDPKFKLRAMLNSGICLRNLKKLPDSLKLLQMGIKMAQKPETKNGYYYEIGRALQEMGKFKESFKFFALVYKTDKTFGDVVHRLKELQPKIKGN